MNEEKIVSAKKYLRREIRAFSASLTDEYRSEASAEITRKLLESGVYKKCGSLFVYISVRGEPDTEGIIKNALADGKQVYVPRCGENGFMEAVRICDTDGFVKNAYGIPEPARGDTADGSVIDLAVIPCVSASYDGRRLGHGGGYYDRFLKETKAEKICLCFDRLIRNEIPTDENDVTMDEVITENT